MNLKCLFVVFGSFFLVPIAAGQHVPENPLPRNENQVVRDVRYELLMLPNAGAFDNITYEVHDGTVTLNGQVVQPSVSSEAENAVAHSNGVRGVVNHIEVLPPLPTDENLRIGEFRSIYQYPGLQKYEIGMEKPIRIIVKNGCVTLEGIVDSDPDRELAGVRAQQVPGILGFSNKLRVVRP